MYRFSALNGSIIFCYMAFSVVSFCSLYVQIDAVRFFHIARPFLNTFQPHSCHSFQSLSTTDYDAIMQFLLCLAVGVGWLFAFCHFGNQATERFKNMATFLYSLEWYEYPTVMQRDLQLMIAISQEIIYIQGFGNTRCTRENFKKVGHLRLGFFRTLGFSIKFIEFGAYLEFKIKFHSFSLSLDYQHDIQLFQWVSFHFWQFVFRFLEH